MRKEWTRRPGGLPLRDYGLIGDCETAALVGRDGSIDWLCWPRFDSSACLASLLGGRDNGFWQIAPSAATERVTRRYREDTLIIETCFETNEGALKLTDMMPIRGKASDIIRSVECLSGTVEFASLLDFRFETGRLKPLIRKMNDREIVALAGPHGVVVRADSGLTTDDHLISARQRLSAGERRTFIATYFPSHLRVPDAVDPERAERDTEVFWREWISRCEYEGPYRKQVARSLITLKAMTYRPTGGIVAAPTTSLPEIKGGERNWDYRCCWLRDAAFSLLALTHAGFRQEAADWRDWLVRAVAGEPHNVHPLYDLAGGSGAAEHHADWLSGYAGSRPVRLGNAAHNQLQLDVFGEVVDAFHLARKLGLHEMEESWELQRHMLDDLATRWRGPDCGIWEGRGPAQNFVHSKVLAWAAFDRGLSSESYFGGHERRSAKWRQARAEIQADILSKGVNRERCCFKRSYESEELDASALLFPMIGFVAPHDPLALGTVAAIEKDLVRDGFVRRYDHRKIDDGLRGGEGAFLACSFWLVDNYWLQGRTDEAHQLFDRASSAANDLGLMSEQYDSASDELLGNFPQCFSHFALVTSALNLSDKPGPAETRLHGRNPMKCT